MKKWYTNKNALLLIVLLISSFTHLWNVVGFPSFHPDEGVYIRRALHVLSGLGPQDPSSSFDHSQDSFSSYDHPYFGQFFLAGIFYLINYPSALHPNSEINSIETLLATPRIIMSLLAVLDTFLIFRISERRFNPYVGFFAALLFGVMPLTWLTRRIVLDSIMLPFILSSILLAIEISNKPKYTKVLCICSGICLGTAIFTKIPAFTMMPLLIFLIYKSLPKINNDYHTRIKNIKIIGLWLIPVILIPMIWPLYAIHLGQFDQWTDGILWQGTERSQTGKSLVDTIESAFKADPILIISGSVAILYLMIRREFLFILWLVPYLSMLFLVGWVTHFHLILILPPLSMAIGKMFYDIPIFIGLRRRFSKLVIPTIGLSIMVIVGFSSLIALTSVNLSFVQIQSISFVAKDIEMNNKNKSTNSEGVTIVMSPIFSWIFKYVFHGNYDTFSHVRDTQPIKSSKILLLVDSTYYHVTSKSEGENTTQVERLQKIFNSTSIAALFSDSSSARYDRKIYPYPGLSSSFIGSRTQEIRTNY